MLNLKRRANERVRIGEDIWVTFKRIDGNQAVLAFEAPPEVKILREELLKQDALAAAAVANNEV